MDEAERARLQREQLSRYLTWMREEGGVEGPTRLTTWFKPHQQERLQWVKERCVGTVMELGCNYGFLLACCNGDIGVDWNAESIALAKILNPSKEFIVADIRKLPFPNCHVDTVLLTDVLEHLPFSEVAKAIAEARRVARRKLIVTVPNGDNDTAEATSMKHMWLADTVHQRALKDLLAPWTAISWYTTFHFFMLETVYL